MGKKVEAFGSAPAKTEDAKAKLGPDALALMPPSKFEVTENSTFDIYLTLKQIGGRWIIAQEKEMNSETYKVTFRMWTFDEMVQLRKLATEWDATKRIHYVDTFKLDMLKVKKLIKSWTFDEESIKLKLLHVNGILSDESWNAFKKLQPNIARSIIDKMNDVLEYNG